MCEERGLVEFISSEGPEGCNHTCGTHHGVAAAHEAVCVEHFGRDGCVVTQTVTHAEDRVSEVLATGHQSAAHEQYARRDAMVQGRHDRVHSHVILRATAHSHAGLQLL